MTVTATVLFDTPQREIASLIGSHLAMASSASIVTGFATPGGLAAISAAIGANPGALKTLVVGSATYKGFEALDNLLGIGVPASSLFVHLGHTRPSGTHTHPYVRYHPLLHSKIYYMERTDGTACAFVGSHNMTAFALTGMNGEASVLLEGPVTEPEFEKIRKHIENARQQAASYSAGMKEACTWWTREYLDGLRVEVGLPQDGQIVRTILLFVEAPSGAAPRAADQLYFEIPSGIEQIESLKTEAHLFLFHKLPPSPTQALAIAHTAHARYKCLTLGAENKQGNKEVVANWKIDVSPNPFLTAIPSGSLRPAAPPGMQQVRVEVTGEPLTSYEYLFEGARPTWEPRLEKDSGLVVTRDFVKELASDAVMQREARGPGGSTQQGWRLVRELIPRGRQPKERDAKALSLVSPDSGSFILVSLRRRRNE